MAGSVPETMRAVVFKGDFEVAVEDRPVPKIREVTDAILKVSSTALCGSDLVSLRIVSLTVEAWSKWTTF